MLTVKRAVQYIEENGCLLVYPLANKAEPASLWSCFFPGRQMKWEWDDSSDSRVAGLWHLREELSRSEKVVYAKWFKGRATFFSRAIFSKFLALLAFEDGIEAESKRVYSCLLNESPLSTKQLKEGAHLKGKANEAKFTRALKPLWERLLIAGFGEVDEGAFPSLAIGATKLLFEDLWLKGQKAQSGKSGKAGQMGVDIQSLRKQIPFAFYCELEALNKKITVNSRPSLKGSLPGVPGKVTFEELSED